MTKADLVERVAKEADMTKKDAEQLVEIVFDTIIGTLNKGEKSSFADLAVSVCASATRGKVAIRKRAIRLRFLLNA